MIRVRDDDIFRLTAEYTLCCQVVDRVKEVHRIVVDEGAIHVIGLLCGTLDWFPGGVEFLVDAFNKGELIPEIHGWEHIDYGNVFKEEIVDHLKRCKEVIYTYFNYSPKVFYTPFGASNSTIKEAAESVDLKMVDCSNILYPKRKFFGGKMWDNYSQIVKENKAELLFHWHDNKYFDGRKSHSLVKTIRTIKNNDPSIWSSSD